MDRELIQIEKDYIDWQLSGARLTKQDLDAIFGSNLEHLQKDAELHRFIADQKLQVAKLRQMQNAVKLNKAFDAINSSIDFLHNTVKLGEDKDRMAAALKLVGPVLSLIQSAGTRVIENGAGDADAAVRRNYTILPDTADQGTT